MEQTFPPVEAGIKTHL